VPNQDFSVELADIQLAGEEHCPKLADTYDGWTTTLGDAFRSAADSFEAPPNGAGGGNALADAIVEAQRFLYEVLEESADGIRATGILILEAAEDTEASDDEVADAFNGYLEEVEAGNYQSSVAAPTDHQDYDPASEVTYGEEMTAWAQQYQAELEGEG
jgi:hypothetical protein